MKRTFIDLLLLTILIVMSSFSTAVTAEENLTEASRLMKSEKYEQAEKAYAAVLSQDAQNAEALKGLDDARIMLRPFYVIQHLVPPPEDKNYAKLNKQFDDAKTPWDKRRAEFAMEKYSIQYTTDMFRLQRSGAEETIDRIIKYACDDVKKGIPAKQAFITAQRKIRKVQDGLNRDWKGSGPPVFKKSLARLKKTYDENGWIVP